MPIKGRRKFKVEFDDYILTSINGELSLTNQVGSTVDLSKLDIGEIIAEKIKEDPYFYYKVIPLSKYFDIITYNLIDSVIEVGGFYGDLLEACYLKDKKSNGDDYKYLSYAFSKISFSNMKIYDPIADEAIQILVEKYGWDFIKIYEDLTSLFKVSKEKAYNKVIESLSESKELDTFKVYIIYVHDKSKAKEILDETVVAPNLNYDFKYVIPRWGLLRIDDNIINLFNELGVKIHKDALKFNETKIFLEKINREKIKYIE
ncbi:hypothetical protein V6M85_09355 [Sulfolobus tengchongensis]|uniref:Methyltransferase n=1 Tax=Sulfolobus tengchongensis TaxID=207809 RepID=A0AAX4L0H2_9CREN